MKTDKYFLQTKPVPAVLAGGYLTKVYVMEPWLTVWSYFVEHNANIAAGIVTNNSLHYTDNNPATSTPEAAEARTAQTDGFNIINLDAEPIKSHIRVWLV